MRVRGIIAVTVAMMLAHAANAAGGPLSLSGPADGEEAGAAGAALFETVSRPGLSLDHRFRLRVTIQDQGFAQVNRRSLFRVQGIDGSRQRRVSSMVDFYPLNESGFRLTAGMRRAPKRARWTPGSASALASVNIFMPKGANSLRVKSNVARSSPVAMLGWSGMLGEETSFSLAAGATQEHGKAMRMTPALIARGEQARAGWSRIGAIAQGSLSVKF